MKKCCNNPKTKKCIRQDKKIFSLPRRFSMKQCKHPKGYSMKASQAPEQSACQRLGPVARVFGP